MVDCQGTPELILIGTGTELNLCVTAAEKLAGEGKKVRVVPCLLGSCLKDRMELTRSLCYLKLSPKRLSVEAGVGFGWHKYVVD